MGTPTGMLQTVLTKSIRLPAEATPGTGGIYVICVAPFTGRLTRAVYAPDSVVTGVVTNNKKVSIEDKGPAGSAATEMAATTFGSGTNAPANDDTALTLGSGVAPDFVAGDIIAARSTVNGTGMALPGGTIEVDLTRD